MWCRVGGERGVVAECEECEECEDQAVGAPLGVRSVNALGPKVVVVDVASHDLHADSRMREKV